MKKVIKESNWSNWIEVLKNLFGCIKNAVCIVWMVIMMLPE